MATRGQRRHLISFFGPGEEVSDGDGGYTQTPTPLTPPRMFAEIKPATARDLERVIANTVQSKASHLITCDFHAQVSTETKIQFGSRWFAVSGVQNPEERGIELVMACEEVVA